MTRFLKVIVEKDREAVIFDSMISDLGDGILKISRKHEEEMET